MKLFGIFRTAFAVLVGIAATNLRTSGADVSSGRSPVLLTLKSIGTNVWQADDKYAGSQVGNHYVSAIIEIKNRSDRPITTKAFMASWLVDYHLSYPSSANMSERHVTRLRSCPQRDPLKPGQTRWFPAVIDSDRPCIVTVDFWRGTNIEFSASTPVIDWKKAIPAAKDENSNKN